MNAPGDGALPPQSVAIATILLPFLLGQSIDHVFGFLIMEGLFDSLPKRFRPAKLQILLLSRLLAVTGRALSVQPQVFDGHLCRQSLIPVFEQSRHQVLCEETVVIPNTGSEVHLPLNYIVDRVTVIFRLKGRSFSDHAVHGHPDGPHINTLVITAPKQYFWCQIQECADNSEHVPPGSPLIGLLTNAKIDNFDPLELRIVKNILGFDIPVANVLLMNVPDRIQHLPKDTLELLDRCSSTCSYFTLAQSRLGKGKFSITRQAACFLVSRYSAWYFIIEGCLNCVMLRKFFFSSMMCSSSIVIIFTAYTFFVGLYSHLSTMALAPSPILERTVYFQQKVLMLSRSSCSSSRENLRMSWRERGQSATCRLSFRLWFFSTLASIFLLLWWIRSIVFIDFLMDYIFSFRLSGSIINYNYNNYILKCMVRYHLIS